MNLIKELHLVVRVLYTFLAVLCFSFYTGFSIGVTIQGVGVIVFVFSFVFEYATLHPVLKEGIKTKRGRAIFLLIWLLVFGGLALLAFGKIPTIDDAVRYPSDDEFLWEFAQWASLYGISWAAFVALACSRRAFESHGKL